jgi:tRNA dimethylallyltransferase
MRGHDRIKIIILTGPTASGKSAMAIDLAERFDGEIVNCDSKQVYRGMDIGTAKPSLEERRRITHHLIDVVNPNEDFNASRYLHMAEPVIKDIFGKNKLCFLVGGTGLYIKTLMGGLIECPPVNREIRERLRNELELFGSLHLFERLKVLDPESSARIHPNDRTRITRALEIIEMTNAPLSSLVKGHGFGEKRYDALKICLSPEREELYRRIDIRSTEMIESGLIRETEQLLESGYSPDLKSMQSIGYWHAVDYIQKFRNLNDSIKLLQRDTRRYAKRQMTWFRADPEMNWLGSEETDRARKLIEDFI